MNEPSPEQPQNLLEVVVRKYRTVMRIGIGRVILWQVHSFFLRGLQRIYGFETWHATSPYEARPYKKAVVDLTNGLKPKTVVEVGSGLGDILVRIDAENRYGVDADLAVTRAVRLLRPGNIHWIHGSASDIKEVVEEQTIDCLIMVGWLHCLDPQTMATAIVAPMLDLMKQNRLKFVILDVFVGELPNDRCHKHDLSFFDGYAKLVSHIALPEDAVRDYFLYEAIPQGGASGPASASVASRDDVDLGR